MGQRIFKLKCVFISYLVLLNVLTKSLPIHEKKLTSIATTDIVFKNPDVLLMPEAIGELTLMDSSDIIEINNDMDVKSSVNLSRIDLLRNVRPGQHVRQYAIELTNNGNSFSGRAILDVFLSTATREESIVLHAEGLKIRSVQAGIITEANATEVDFEIDGSLLKISPKDAASSYIVIIQYDGQYSNGGRGFHMGKFNDGQGTYLAMNLHPTYARYVFPCMDEPTEVSTISFTYKNLEYTHLLSNSMLEENSLNQFRALQGPPHVWGMMAHNFLNINLPVAQVFLYGRTRIDKQDSQASVAINSYFNQLNEWTNKPYFDILLNQDGKLNIMALPDVSTDWHALSTIGIWEPYIFMEEKPSVTQRKLALIEIAHAMAKQWFGFVIFPENWRYEWVVSGLASYAAYEIMRAFQTNAAGLDVTLLDVNTLFVTDIIQESLLRDAYAGAQILEPKNDLFEEDEIRDHVHGLIKYKAPALLRMMRIILGNPEQDFIQSAARALLSGRALQTVNSLNFVDAINSDWMTNGNNIIEDVDDYLENWKFNPGYPVLHVGLGQGRVMITQEHFSFDSKITPKNFLIPITYTTSMNPDFTNFQPIMMTDGTSTLSFPLGEDDWVLFNIQGQAYYRVNYENNLWERIIESLEDPVKRAVIHPLNRATLIDDALNLARAETLDYDIALRVVLTMELETEYAVWKAFVRNMEFIRKRLIALVTGDDDLDPDIYSRMIRRTIVALENKLGFEPDIALNEPVMDTLTRGLVMDHACRANYQPCIAAAVDWFYVQDNNELVVNPDIPHEIRPAVYCTMVREGDNNVIAALNARLEIETTLYERVVILESLACSQDSNFIRMYLTETIATNSPYSVEERNRIFAAVARSSFENAAAALNFMSSRTSEIRNMYGGPEKLEELIYILSENLADEDTAREFSIWVNAQNNNLDDSQSAANRIWLQVDENVKWDKARLQKVYEWIDENDASTIVLSIVALYVSVIVAMFNH